MYGVSASQTGKAREGGSGHACEERKGRCKPPRLCVRGIQSTSYTAAPVHFATSDSTLHIRLHSRQIFDCCQDDLFGTTTSTAVLYRSLRNCNQPCELVLHVNDFHRHSGTRHSYFTCTAWLNRSAPDLALRYVSLATKTTRATPEVACRPARLAKLYDTAPEFPAV